MTTAPAPWVPPFCPNAACRYHRQDRELWRFRKAGFFTRKSDQRRVERRRCDACRRYFSSQTFSPTYWMKRPDLQRPVFWRLVGCSGYRQIAREFAVSPQTILTHAARLGRHALLFHEQNRPRGPIREPVALDSFQGFEWSQHHPTLFHLVTGKDSHFTYGFTESEIRRSGRMTDEQKIHRLLSEQLFGRPDPRSIEKEVAAVLSIVTTPGQSLELHTDEHTDYPRALRRLRDRCFQHRTVSSRKARTSQNPLFAVNLLDLLIRHSGANHKRETIAHSKRRQGAIDRLWVFLTWRNWMKWFSELRRDGTPAMKRGVTAERVSYETLMAQRLFPGRIDLPERWTVHYRRLTPTRRIARIAVHRLKYAD
jgi:transposase-like protein